jgi:hypothetical protein
LLPHWEDVVQLPRQDLDCPEKKQLAAGRFPPTEYFPARLRVHQVFVIVVAVLLVLAISRQSGAWVAHVAFIERFNLLNCLLVELNWFNFVDFLLQVSLIERHTAQFINAYKDRK